MKTLVRACFLLILVATGCGTTKEGSSSAPPLPETKESLYTRGHVLYQEGRHDSAAHYLERSRALDRAFLPPLNDLAEIYYVAGMAGAGNERESNLRAALGCFEALDSLGQADETTYDRLTELSYQLGETDVFLFYAEKQIARYPGDRQSYNLGLAYFGSGRFQKVIETQKEAIEKYPHSPYIAGFYRLLGDGYFGIDRQQSAERTYEEGVRVVPERVRGMKEADTEFIATTEYRHLADNYKAMLTSLKKIYRLHGKQDKLKQLESRPDSDP